MPEYSHLLIAKKQAKKLDEEREQMLYLVVARILYVMQIARFDLET